MRRLCACVMMGLLFIGLSVLEVYSDETGNDDLSAKVSNLDNLFGKLKFYGDYRGRWEGNETKQRKSVTTADYVHWRNRYRYRLRLGLQARINDEIMLNTRMAGGTGRTSTNQTYTGGSLNDNWGVDLAYFQYKPHWVKDWLTLYIGKMNNPLYNTQMIFDSDLTPEGASIHTNWKEVFGTKWNVYSDVFGYIINESATRNQDAWVWGGGAGFLGNIGNFVDLKAGANYYTWIKPEMVAQTWTTSTTTPGNLVRLDGQMLSEFDVLEAKGNLKFKALDHQVILTGSYIVNTSANADTDGKKWDDGIYGQAKFGKMTKAGKNKDVGDWWLSYMYYDLAPDATPAIFADADLRGTNTKSHEIELEYKFLPNTTIGGTAHFIGPHVRYNPFYGTELRDVNLYFIDVVTNF